MASQIHFNDATSLVVEDDARTLSGRLAAGWTDVSLGENRIAHVNGANVLYVEEYEPPGAIFDVPG